ncbi:hypothetical protein QFZ52_001041 [Arthrobacter woluwensis]|nr:hypothetical protein [Arthrobacter woluwensis]
MLTYLQEHPVDYVIVHKLDRLARPRADDIAITQAVHAAGARLISSTKGIDMTPNGTRSPVVSHNARQADLRGFEPLTFSLRTWPAYRYLAPLASHQPHSSRVADRGALTASIRALGWRRAPVVKGMNKTRPTI